MICELRWQVDGKQVFPSLSDHKSIQWTLRLFSPTKAKAITILDRKASEQNTATILESKTVVNASTFLREMKKLRQEIGIPTKEIQQKTQKNNELMELILTIKKSEEINDIVREYWKTKWNLTEKDRFSIESKRAYQNLRKILKYHLFEKRDGSIIKKLSQKMEI